jgi:hypothetical protein
VTAPKLRTLRAIPPTIGIDPGSGQTGTSSTGLVAVVGVELVGATLVREPHHKLATSLRRYFLRVVGLVDAWSRELRPHASWTVAVEFCGMLCAHYRAIVVCPDRRGRRCPVGGDLSDYYPRQLGGRRPAGWAGEGRSRDHERAAYDIAFAAHRQRHWLAQGA